MARAPSRPEGLTHGCSRHVGSLAPSPGAALAAHGARRAVALLHDHADVGLHELGHVHHLRPRHRGRAQRGRAEGRRLIPPGAPAPVLARVRSPAGPSAAFPSPRPAGRGSLAFLNTVGRTAWFFPTKTTILPDGHLAEFTHSKQKTPLKDTVGVLRAGMTPPDENTGDRPRPQPASKPRLTIAPSPPPDTRRGGWP